jgi:hypothetical protein
MFKVAEQQCQQGLPFWDKDSRNLPFKARVIEQNEPFLDALKIELDALPCLGRPAGVIDGEVLQTGKVLQTLGLGGTKGGAKSGKAFEEVAENPGC